MNARQKPTISSAKYPSLRAVFGKKLQNKTDATKFTSHKLTIDKLCQNTLSKKPSIAKIDERAFKENSKLKVQLIGHTIREVSDLESRDVTMKLHNARKSVEKSFMAAQNGRQVVNTHREEKASVRLLQKPSPKIKKLISQGIMSKNIITKQLQNNISGFQMPTPKALANPKITYRKSANTQGSQNVNTTNVHNNTTKGRNEVKQTSKNSTINQNKSINNVSAVHNDKDFSSMTLLKSQKAKIKIAQPELVAKPSNSILNKINFQTQRNLKPKYIESFDCGRDGLDEVKNLNCEEAMIRNRYNVKTEMGVDDIESEEEILIESDDQESIAAPEFDHNAFENLYDIDTIDYLVSQEELYKTKADYIERHQRNIVWTMRAILLDWMQEVCSDYLFKRETFHYAINYVDRYLTIVHHIEVKDLQLVGLGALFLAAKMEEVYTPKIDNIVTAANNSYSQAQLRATESQIYRVS